jgi:hypothetical protein
MVEETRLSFQEGRLILQQQRIVTLQDLRGTPQYDEAVTMLKKVTQPKPKD